MQYTDDETLYTPTEVDVFAFGGGEYVRKSEYDKAYKYVEILKAQCLIPKE